MPGLAKKPPNMKLCAEKYNYAQTISPIYDEYDTVQITKASLIPSLAP